MLSHSLRYFTNQSVKALPHALKSAADSGPDVIAATTVSCSAFRSNDAAVVVAAAALAVAVVAVAAVVCTVGGWRSTVLAVLVSCASCPVAYLQ